MKNDNNTREEKQRKIKLELKRIFIDNWALKACAILAGIMMWLLIGYVF